MKLLFVFDIGFDKRGPSVHLLQDILREALKENYTVDVVLKNTGGPDPLMPLEFKNHPRFRYHVIDDTEKKKAGFVGRYFGEIHYANRCWKLISKLGKFDAVFLQSCTAAIFYMVKLKKLHCRIVFNVQDIFPYNLKLSGQLPFSSVSFPIFRKLQNMAYNKADVIITISEDMKKTLVEDGVLKDKIKVAYNWSYDDIPITASSIDQSDFFDLGTNPEEFAVVYAGNIGKMQNVELVANAAILTKNDQKIKYYIIGDGANKNNIYELTKGLKNIKVLPMQPSKFAESIYAQADVNIIPLVKGGIRTALPSKTATCLRVNRPIIFCIDKDCEFNKLIDKDCWIRSIGTDNAEQLVEAIYSIKNSYSRTDMVSHHDTYQYFDRKNARSYIEAMING